MGSLTRRLACCLALKILDSTSESSQGLADFSNLWMEFVHFLYNHWEKGSNLPRLSLVVIFTPLLMAGLTFKFFK